MPSVSGATLTSSAQTFTQKRRNNYAQKLIENMFYLLMTVLWLTYDAFVQWWSWFRVNVVTMQSRRDHLLYVLQRAQTYDEWKQIAHHLDVIMNNGDYCNDPVSVDYDFRLISKRLSQLRKARQQNDVQMLIYRLRAGLLRNLGGITDVKLYQRSLLRTKKLIEEYIEEVLDSFRYVTTVRDPQLSFQSKLEFFADTRQSFGNTALILHGGATFGLYHLGVAKCLFYNNLLPRVISSSSVGALVAALVCVHTDQELPAVFQAEWLDLRAFKKVATSGQITRKLQRLLKTGHLLDVNVLDECVKDNIGDITFEEAFQRSKRILNIVVSTVERTDVPKLLNYLTAPNVLVRTAAMASCAGTGLYDSLPLLAKDARGQIYQFHKQLIQWRDASADEGPTMRLTELFNVNHVIMSQANPFVLPFVTQPVMTKNTLTQKMRTLISMEIRHRLNQLNDVGLLPLFMRGIIDKNMMGNITITPEVSIQDNRLVFSNPSTDQLSKWIVKGEQATWRHLNLIYHRLVIELELDRILLSLKASNGNT
ncbi:hypothetical protein MIR68_006760 [Amoeboaphelidium protococcarum]|nr:hypothetical protein MIR68_006760 [Amoeboaphelidium protococcarum]